MIKSSTLLLILWFLISPFGTVDGQSYFEIGESFYQKRGENATGSYAPKKNINQALKNYKKAEKTPETIGALLKAYEYKGSYTKQSKKNRKIIYKKAVKLGKKALEAYPDHISIKYYYMANLGRWGQTVSILNAHDKGVIDKIRTIAAEIMEVDSTYDEAGSQRILGGIHLKAPNIPFVLTWPSDDVALELLSSAYRYAPDNIGNCNLYAEVLIEMDRRVEAKELLQNLANRKPRKARVLEDLRNIEKTKELLESYYRISIVNQRKKYYGGQAH